MTVNLSKDDQLISVKKHNKQLSELKVKLAYLEKRLKKSKLQNKIGGKFDNLLKDRYPQIYWELAAEMKGDYAEIKRVIAEPGSLTKLYDGIFAANGYACARCFAPIAFRKPDGNPHHIINLEIDHIWEKADGGDGDARNLQPLCLDCHVEKTRIFQNLRKKTVITRELAHEINKMFLDGASHEKMYDFTYRKHLAMTKLRDLP